MNRAVIAEKTARDDCTETPTNQVEMFICRIISNLTNWIKKQLSFTISYSVYKELDSTDNRTAERRNTRND